MNWTDAGFGHHPVAPLIGPFASAEFLELVWRYAGSGDLEFWRSDTAMMPIARIDGNITMAGPEHLVDYRSPLGAGVAELVAANVGDDSFRFDSLPLEAAKQVMKGTAMAGRTAQIQQHGSAAVLALPDSFDVYMAERLSKKERHEMRRKRRRYEAVLGESHFVHHDAADGIFQDFVRFHRMAAGDKGNFMTEKMEEFFADLIGLDGWGLDALVADDGHITAAGFGYFDRDGYYLYNSSYNPDLAETSPGVVLLGRLIELTIDRQQSVFDFLKGDEAYKYRLPAVARPLLEVVSAT